MTRRFCAFRRDHGSMNMKALARRARHERCRYYKAELRRVAYRVLDLLKKPEPNHEKFFVSPDVHVQHVHVSWRPALDPPCQECGGPRTFFWSYHHGDLPPNDEFCGNCLLGVHRGEVGA